MMSLNLISTGRNADGTCSQTKENVTQTFAKIRQTSSIYEHVQTGTYSYLYFMFQVEILLKNPTKYLVSEVSLVKI